jgi:hypothetical protein
MLGDGEAVEQALRIAEDLAARTRDTKARERVHAIRERLTEQVVAVGP